MASEQSFLHFFLFFLMLGLASSSHISTDVLEPRLHGPLSRSLLQQKSNCPVNFENMNYTVITSQCKGPNYTPERCCTPLKELLCPISDQINDLKNNCADTFFSYINLYGKYPPGLFASLCKDDQHGLDCSSLTPPPSPITNGVVLHDTRPPALIMFIVGLVILIIFHI